MPIIGHLSQIYLGGGTDPICHIRAIAWWPYALIHRTNPLIAHTLWAPVGYNLGWGMDIPGPSLLIYPITNLSARSFLQYTMSHSAAGSSGFGSCAVSLRVDDSGLPC